MTGKAASPTISPAVSPVATVATKQDVDSPDPEIADISVKIPEPMGETPNTTTPHVSKGRPRATALLRAMSVACAAREIPRCAVMACGPASLVRAALGFDGFTTANNKG
jgi:hypothetical protein